MSDKHPFFRFLAGAAVVIACVPALADDVPRLTSPGPYDEMIKAVQQKLNDLGFDAGPANGDFGEKLQAAIAQFQIANLLPASGSMDEATMRELGVERQTEGVSAAAGSSAQ